MKKKKIWKKPILYLIVIIVLLSVSAGIMLFNLIRQKQYDVQLSLGEKYLKELDYENAELYFKNAIEINSKKAKPYLYLADIYADQGNYAQVASILKRGQELIGDEVFHKRMMFYDVEIEKEIDNVIEQDDTENIVHNTLGLSYIGDKTYLLDIYPFSMDVPRCTAFEETGYISFKRKDFDSDGQEEILVITAVTDGSGYDDISNYIYMVMLENKGDTWVKSAENKVASHAMSWDDYLAISYMNNSVFPYRVGLFCKELEGIQYLFAEYSGHSGYASAFSDGTEWELQQYSYRNNEFIKVETGLYMGGGSDIQAELNLNPEEAYNAEYADTINTKRDILSQLGLLPADGVGYDNELMGKMDGIEALVQIEKKTNVDTSELRNWDFQTTIYEAVQVQFIDYAKGN